MRYWMDEVWFEQGGAEVHMRKGTRTCTGTISQDENKTSHYCRAERDAVRVPDEGKLSKPVGTGENETC
jgi:hypothetical protein